MQDAHHAPKIDFIYLDPGAALNQICLNFGNMAGPADAEIQMVRIDACRSLFDFSLDLRHSREITILCSAKVTQHHATAGALLPLNKTLCC